MEGFALAYMGAGIGLGLAVIGAGLGIGRLAANMTGGHIAILAILSFVFLFTELFGRAVAGIGVGLAVSVPLAVGISTLEILVVLIQAYVFTLLTAVFIGMAIHVHH